MRRCVGALPNHLASVPDLSWLKDKTLLGSELSEMLQRTYVNRVPSQQWYVSLAPVGNPEFPHEANYPAMNIEFVLRTLAVFRFWNVIEYWYPYRDLIGASWDDVLKEYVPKVGLARSLPEYQREIIALAARIEDSQEYVLASVASRPPQGSCTVPISLRSVENQAVIVDLPEDSPSVQRGDVVAKIDGVSISGLMDRWRPYYGLSNEAARLREMALT